MDKGLKIVLWIANEANQRALANRIHQKFPVSAIVTESRKSKRKITLKKLVEKAVEKIFLRSIGRSWFGMLQYYGEKYPDYPDVPSMDVENINSDEVFEFTKNLDPDLIIVSGTRLIRKKLLSLKARIGIMNLHTGLSPYIKGGPNCTNWCLSDGEFHLIGNTVMWIDEGIDSGNIMATELTSLSGNESLSDIHIKVMDHAHDLYIRSIEKAIMGKINNIQQDQIATGKTYYTREWGLKQKIKLVRNLKQFRKALASGNIQKEQSGIKTISLES